MRARVSVPEGASDIAPPVSDLTAGKRRAYRTASKSARTQGEGTVPETVPTVPTAPARSLRVVLPGLMLAILLAMLDNMIVGSAIPPIVGELGGLGHSAWVA